MELLLGVTVRPFQTIIGHKGSQQRAHSDSIHMTTYPLGYLAAAWIALEDIGDGSGPLIYYPRSHRLPYLFSRDVGISAEDYDTRGYLPYHERYEPAVADLVERNGIEARRFLARKGDVLVWHANLLHGGAPRTDLQLTRKALVCHYFADGAVCYHDLASAPAGFSD
jgi:ectoine hydroxylase-related dioxygenase (phytanoyl-CoA dioxygenase family)